MNNKISFGIWIFCLIILFIYASNFKDVPSEWVYPSLVPMIGILTYAVAYIFQQTTVKYYKFCKNITYSYPLKKILVPVHGMKSFWDDIVWFFILGAMINFLITFFLGIAPVKTLVASIPLVGQVLSVALENVGILFNPEQINSDNYPFSYLPFSSIGFVLLYIIRMQFHRVTKNKHRGAQFLLVLMYATTILLSINAYVVLANIDPNLISHDSIEKFWELFGSAILVSLIFGGSSAFSIILFDHYLLKQIHSSDDSSSKESDHN